MVPNTMMMAWTLEGMFIETNLQRSQLILAIKKRKWFAPYLCHLCHLSVTQTAMQEFACAIILNIFFGEI